MSASSPWACAVRLLGARRVALVTFALAAIACGQPVPPPVAVRQPSLEAEDLAVIRALFDDFFRPALSKTVRATGIAPRFLVVDTTMAMCRRDPDVLGPQPGRCLSHDHANILSKVVPAETFPSVKLRFPSWNAAAVSIPGSLGDDVILVSPNAPRHDTSGRAPAWVPTWQHRRMAECALLSGTGHGGPRVWKLEPWRGAARETSGGPMAGDLQCLEVSGPIVQRQARV